MIKPPSAATLKKYGLSSGEWIDIIDSQGYVCAICKKCPKSLRFVIDHEHIKGWKKLPPSERKLFVRGILCWFCNRYYVTRGITVEKAKNIVKYLESYEKKNK